jgi:tetratricopeptide (TPR) repeat protein
MEKTSDFFQASICKLLFPHAIELARNGNYKEAEESLRFILSHDSSPEYFMLLGRIYAQQGIYQEAIDEWTKTLEIDPGNQEARAAILKAEELTQAPLPSQFFKWRLTSAILGLFLVLSLGISVLLWQKKANVAARYEDFLRNNQFLSSRFQELEKEYEHLKEEGDVGQKYQDVLAEYKDIEKRFEELKQRSDGQLVSSLEREIGDYLAQIKGLADHEIIIKQRNGHTWVYGEVPTWYLKDLIGKMVRQSKEVESVDITGIEVTHKYTISSGDELRKIAESLYGDSKGWREIFEANRKRIENPDMIRSGICLYIP